MNLGRKGCSQAFSRSGQAPLAEPGVGVPERGDGAATAPAKPEGRRKKPGDGVEADGERGVPPLPAPPLKDQDRRGLPGCSLEAAAATRSASAASRSPPPDRPTSDTAPAALHASAMSPATRSAGPRARASAPAAPATRAAPARAFCPT